MTIDEAIKHAEEVAEKNEKKAKSYPKPNKNVKGSGRKYNDCIECASEHRQLAEWLKDYKRLLEQEPKTDWIPVSERLPDVGSEVLVCYEFKKKRYVYIANFYGDEKFHGYDDEYLTTEGRKYRKAVAWMPLPSPYKAESEDK